MALVASSQPNKALKIFSSKLYKIRARPLNFLVQILSPLPRLVTEPIFPFNPNVSIKIGLSGTPLPWESQRQREARFSPTRPQAHFAGKRGAFFLAALRLPLSDALLSPTPPPRRPSLCVASCLRSGAPTDATPPALPMLPR